MYQKILLAADGSDHSIRAASHAIKVAQIDQGKIDILYAVDGKTSKEDVLHGLDKYDVKKERQEKLKPVIDIIEEAGLECETHVVHGEPGPAIVDFANNNEYDFVVVGSRGLNQVQTMILGSVSHKIAKRVHCPVLIVK
ncbi:Nucleotide-binding universal stress protein, UspA family [Gracilibacillus orientalis]|uniref:Nucleotide-binding universal stress protein, UspA family n=1 Tax=Gracilibacillus orientalis TaxID=334253 RepID=A0A1I4QUM4_9BACI|nr:universal stress protein [Gracilibacillus orientalis]SFM43403.1 Nucleotide-binding universal stress protein, UspA family [Gracilibacillus orientalis]